MRAGKTGIHLNWREVDAVVGALGFGLAGPMDGHTEAEIDTMEDVRNAILDIPKRPHIEWPADLEDDDDY